MSKNIDHKTVAGFGDEWERFDQSNLDGIEHDRIFATYFKIFPWELLPPDAEGFDMGCGSGRWAKKVAPRVRRLHCVDPSSAINVARRNLQDCKNCEFYQAGVGDAVFKEHSMDFGYSLGVLHHIPDTQSGIIECVKFLKPGAPFLIYLYYNFDNRSLLYRWLWLSTEVFRLIVSRSPHRIRYLMSQILAYLIYYPLARTARVFERLGLPAKAAEKMPLGIYRNLSLYTMRTDALDRFGTRLEQRFSRSQVAAMMEKAGLSNIKFSDDAPFWCAIGIKK